MSPAPAQRPALAVLAGGAAAGVLDIAAAFTIYGLRGATPPRILQSIASGVLGAAAFEGGAATAALGLVLHFVIATGAALGYYAASRFLPDLARRPIPWGAAFGVGVFLFMNFVVLPLSNVAQRPFVWSGTAFLLVAVHVAFVGVPIALAVRRFAGVPGSA